jgi:hypothetical protein
MNGSDVITDMSDTTLRVSVETRDQLVDLGKKNESYDTILRRLIAHWKKNPPKE